MGTFDGKKLTFSALPSYIKEEYGDKYLINRMGSIKKMRLFLQNDYGKDNDCTLVSIMTCICYYLPELDPKDVYAVVEQVAKKYLYCSWIGTLPFVNKMIYKECLAQFGLDKVYIYKPFKDILFNYEDIVSLIKNQKPIILSIFKDGRKYYDGHTVTIVGFQEFKVDDNKYVRFLEVYDNWSKVKTYIDYEKMSVLSQIVY